MENIIVLTEWHGNSWGWGGALLIVILFGIALAFVFSCLIPEDKYETHYQVTVDNSVSMNEFQNKYEIIEVEGKIYTVRERVE